MDRGWMDRVTDQQMGGWIDRKTNGRLNKWIDGLMD